MQKDVSEEVKKAEELAKTATEQGEVKKGGKAAGVFSKIGWILLALFFIFMIIVLIKGGR